MQSGRRYPLVDVRCCFVVRALNKGIALLARRQCIGGDPGLASGVHEALLEREHLLDAIALDGWLSTRVFRHKRRGRP